MAGLGSPRSRRSPLAGFEGASTAGGSAAGPSSAAAAGPALPPPSKLDLHLLPNPPQPVHLAPYLSPSSPLSPSEKRALLTSVYLRAASAGNADTLEWLLSLPPDPALSSAANAAAARRFSLTAAQLANSPSSPGGAGSGVQGESELPDAAPRKWVDLEARDEEGNTALGLCVALGHAEAVRVLVESGVRVNAVDRAGWTPLHWAAQNNDIPIASYLLNHRSSPLIASHKGLTPRDLVKPGKEGAAMREVLQMAWEAAVERERAARRAEELAGDGSGVAEDGRPASRLSLASLAGGGAGGVGFLPDAKAKEEEQARDKERKRRIQLGQESALNLEVDMGVLGLEDVPRRDPTLRPSSPSPSHSSDTDSDSDSPPPAPFQWDRCLPDQMLVFALTDLPTLFDVIITTIKPVRERRYRVIPANVLFLCARFAHYFGNEELLEELMIGAMERVEAAIHNRPDDMANCAFWLSNCLLLLYYLRKDPGLSQSTSTYQAHLCDLLNEIFVFVIRDAERRIDRVLEAAMLEHEALPGFEDVAFEDEWASTRFVKKLTARGKKGGIRTSVSARSLFSAATASDTGPGVGDSPPRSRHVSASHVPLADANPRSITALLSSTLFVLQLYEIPPSIVVQAFSQLFYWIGCEVFNRLLTQRKYLCRSRAMQIRLNASNLEDWARANRLPTKMVSVHFAPLNQLLQWLQCLSSESSIDGLIGTVQSLHALNPLQLRRAVREYRYEVEESRMDEDCVQYLVQIQKQWERLRTQKQVRGLAAGGESQGGELDGAASPGDEDNASVASAQDDVLRMIDEAFADPSSFGSYTPPGGAEALGELLNSRFMMLVSFNQPDAFGPFASSRPASGRSPSDGTTTPRSSSRLSMSSRMSTHGTFPPLADDAASVRSVSLSSVASAAEREPPEPFTPVLPDDFFAVWDAAKAKSGAPRAANTSAALLAGVKSWDKTPALGGGEWTGWDEAEHDDEESEEGSVVDYGEDETSFDSEASGMDGTPRPRAGFQP
ncbi:hypothetical protein JCM10213v2_001045 [Rhodosporidiobolus nylandii]